LYYISFQTINVLFYHLKLNTFLVDYSEPLEKCTLQFSFKQMPLKRVVSDL